MRSPLSRAVAALLAVSFLAACGTLSSARPLEPGQHEVGATLGGPLVEALGLTIPLPNLVVEGRSGATHLADRPLEVSYGLNTTGLAFGVVQGHVGLAWLALEERRPWPAVALVNRLFLGANPFGLARKDENAFGTWVVIQPEAVASWRLGQHLAWVGLALPVDAGNPRLLLTPSVGGTFDLGKPAGFALHLEARYYALTARPDVTTVRWWPGGHGALGILLGASYRFGEAGS